MAMSVLYVNHLICLGAISRVVDSGSDHVPSQPWLMVSISLGSTYLKWIDF